MDKSSDSRIQSKRQIHAKSERKIDDRIILQRASIEDILASIEGSFFVLDKKYKYSYFNSFHAKRMKDLYGAEIKLGEDILSYISNPNDAKKVKENLDRALEGESVQQQTQSGDPQRKCIWIFARHIPVFNSSGKIVGVSVFTVDLTKEMQTQEALRQSQEKFLQIVTAAQEGILMMDAKGTVTYINKVLADWVGYSIDEVMGKSAFEFVPKKDLEQAYTHWEKRKKGITESYDFRIKTQKGKDVWVIISGSPLTDAKGNFSGTLALFTNITDRKKAEIALREAEERFRALVESTSDMIWQVDENGVYTYVSPKVKDILGYEPEEVVGKTPFELIDEEDADRVLREFLDIVNDKEAFHGLENCNVHKNGSLVMLETSGVPVLDENKQLTGYRGIDRDITDRKKAEEALRISEEKFSKVFKNSPIAVTITRLTDGNVIDVNQAAVEMFGYSRQEAIGNTSLNLKAWDDPNDRTLFVQALSSQGSVRDNEYVFRKKDGSKLIVSMSAEIIEFQEQKCIVSSFVDITENKLLQNQLEEYNKRLEVLVEERTKQLREAERLAVIGQTAGMVGHDLRNPLQAIVAELYLAKMELNDLEDGPRKTKMIEAIENLSELANYMDKIVSDLQTFVKPVTVNKQVVALEKLIATVLAQSKIPNEVYVNLQIDGAQQVDADPELLKRVLINLVTNAIQAMPNGGELTIETKTGNKGSVDIVVTDTGGGISDEIKPKIFEPLFTTKSKGQGFGLAVCKRVIEAQGGTISFDSETGKGTKFSIILPK